LKFQKLGNGVIFIKKRVTHTTLLETTNHTHTKTTMKEPLQLIICEGNHTLKPSSRGHFKREPNQGLTGSSLHNAPALHGQVQTKIMRNDETNY